MPKRLSEQRARTVARELLTYREWDVRPASSNGQSLEESEYKHYSSLSSLFPKSKKGSGSGKPDFLLLESAASLLPVLLIETKPKASDIDSAMKDARHYGDSCRAAGHDVLIVGVAGAAKEICAIRVERWIGGSWQSVTLNGKPIDWIPSLVKTQGLLATPGKTAVEPERPSDATLAAQANRMNEILRECKIKDEYRPVYAATFLLGLWQGDVSTDKSVVLKQVNANAEQALKSAKKPELAHSLRIDDENAALAARAWEIVDILKKLNIRSFTQEHDYLGQLYETFFRYTGGNTIGQYFTPRHIVALMCELTNVTDEDIVFDPACGTGGFLIGALNRMVREAHLSYDEGVKKIANNLFGMESEPATAALCIANMILRGDGKSGVVKDNCFTNTTYPKKAVQVALMNPPFPHKKTDTPAQAFIDRALCSLEHRGVLGSIVPYSLLLKDKDWRERILKENRLLFVGTLPADSFQPYASFDTAIVLLQKGIPHAGKHVFFCHISNDGYKVKKNVRIPRGGSQLPTILKAYDAKTSMPELCAYKPMKADADEWSPEAFIENDAHNDEVFIRGFEESIREQAATYLYFGPKLLQAPTAVNKGVAEAPRAYSSYSAISLEGVEMAPLLIDDHFDIELGGKDEIEDLEEGEVPIVSTSAQFNGITTWRKPNRMYGAPLITTATDGSVCSSFVQEYPFYTFYKVAMLRPKAPASIPTDALYFIAYLLRNERWRYVYARKFGKKRISKTTVIAPSKGGKPDFELMAKLTRKTAAFPIIDSFRAAMSAAKPTGSAPVTAKGSNKASPNTGVRPRKTKAAKR